MNFLIKEFNKSLENKYGIILVFISLILLICLSIISFTILGIVVDEIYSFSLMQVPFNEMLGVMVGDVPPLYYFIFKIFAKISIFTNITTNMILVRRFVSILPLYLLFIVILTRFRKNFGWLASGIFLITLVSMPGLINSYLYIRMYSFSLFFITYSFIVVYDILKESSTWNWLILTILTICSAYTNYYSSITSFLIYLFLLIYLIVNNRNQLKKIYLFDNYFYCCFFTVATSFFKSTI